MFIRCGGGKLRHFPLYRALELLFLLILLSHLWKHLLVLRKLLFKHLIIRCLRVYRDIRQVILTDFLVGLLLVFGWSNEGLARDATVESEFGGDALLGLLLLKLLALELLLGLQGQVGAQGLRSWWRLQLLSLAATSFRSEKCARTGVD